MKHYLIDGLNVVHKSQLLKSKLSQGKEIAVASLFELIKQFSANYPSYFITIFIDGVKSSQVLKTSKIDTIFSGKNKIADESIKEFIAKYHKSKQITVVSSDTEVHNFARIHSCETLESNAFLGSFQSLVSNNHKSKAAPKSKEKPNTCSRRDFAEFMEYFSEDLE